MGKVALSLVPEEGLEPPTRALRIRIAGPKVNDFAGLHDRGHGSKRLKTAETG